jgi:hypothetical protein
VREEEEEEDAVCLIEKSCSVVEKEKSRLVCMRGVRVVVF